MTTANTTEKVSYEQFREEWLAEIEDGNPSSLEKGRRFATKLVTQWLGVTTDDDDFVICDGSGDGGIDIAYLKHADIDTEAQDESSLEGDTWYLVQSKYGTALAGADTVLDEGRKIIAPCTVKINICRTLHNICFKNLRCSANRRPKATVSFWYWQPQTRSPRNPVRHSKT